MAATIPVTTSVPVRDFAQPDLATLDLAFTTPSGAHRLVYSLDRSSPVQEDMRAMLASGSFYEPETTILLGSVLKPGDVFVDVGAHVGYFSVLAASLVGATGQVISFEPAPANYARLVEHIRLNGLRHVLPLHCAAGAEEGVFDLHVNSDNDGGHALWDVGLHPHNRLSRAAPRTHPVFVATLDRVLGNVAPGRIKAIKIDVEGGEHAVLRGARRTLETQQVPFVIAEVNRTGLAQLGTGEAEMRAFMTVLGYETWLLQSCEPQMVRLDPTQTIAENHVFNLLFRRPGVVVG